MRRSTELAGWRPGDPIEGYALVLSMAVWLDELLGKPFSPAMLRQVQLIQGYLLIHLQQVDDETDGQSQIPDAGRADPLAEAKRRLATSFAVGDPFWNEFNALMREQERSRAWEIARRGRPPPAFDARLRRALGAKAALLRWPAAAMARLARRPGMKTRLDELCLRFLTVALLLDDLTDVEEDAAAGRMNAILCAGRVFSDDPFHVYPRAIRGAGVVCRWIRAELRRLAAKGAPSAEFSRICEDLRVRTIALERSFARAHQVRLLQRIVEELASPRKPRSR